MQQESPEFKPGMIIADRYRLAQRLGDGNFGEVWRAVDVRLERQKIDLANMFAIKFLKNEYVYDPEVRAEFGTEIRTLYQLTHHNLLRLFDFDLLPDMAYLVTEFAQGGSLAYQLARKGGPFSLTETNHYLQQTAAGLDSAHSHKFVHRDLKPHNLLVTGQNRLVVADFGLSQIYNISATRSMIQGKPCGTPAYMAPEQWEYLAGRRSDIYAVGIILYQMLTGRLPFRANNGSPQEWRTLHREAPIPSLQKVKPDLPIELDEVIASALAKDPKDRPQSAGELAEHFRYVLEGLAHPRKNRPPFQPGITKNGASKPTADQDTLPLAARENGASLKPTQGLPLLANGISIATQRPGSLPKSDPKLASPAGKTDSSLIRKLGATKHQRTPRTSYRFIPLGSHIRTFAGHTNYINSLAFSPDGTLLASASLDRSVRLWNVESGEVVKTLTGHNGAVYSVAFSPDGHYLASASADWTVKLWQLPGGEPVRILEGHAGLVAAVGFSPDGALLASASADRTIKLWDADNWKLLETLQGHTDNILALAFSPENDGLVSASKDGTLRLWELPGGVEVAVLEGHDQAVSAVSFAPDGKQIASGSHDKSVKLWSLETGLDEKTFRNNGGDWVQAVAFSHDGRTLASASNLVKLRDVSSTVELAIIEGHSDLINAIAFSPDDRYLATGADDKLIKLWATERMDAQ